MYNNNCIYYYWMMSDFSILIVTAQNVVQTVFMN